MLIDDWQPQAVLFDLDGTLIDSFRAIAASVNHVLACRHLPQLDPEFIRSKVGYGLMQLLGELVPVGDPEENARLYHEHHPSVMREGTELLPGAVELLQDLQQQGLRAAICSNKPSRLSRILAYELGIAGYLDVILGPEDVANKKPAPDMLWEACRQLDFSPQDCLFVGDMTIDVASGRAAGVTTWVMPIGAQTQEQLAEAQPDRIVSDLYELRRLLITL